MRSLVLHGCLLACCTVASAQPAPPSRRDLGAEFVRRLARGDYGAAQRMLGAPLSRAPTATLRTTWRRVERNHGAWQAIVAVDSTGEETHGGRRVDVVTVHCRFARDPMQIRVNLDGPHITSLWVLPDTVSAALRRSFAAVDSLASAEYGKDSVGALTVGLWTGGHLAWVGSYGWAEAGRKAGRETIYRIGSITKMFTAALLLQLVDRGVVSFDEPITRRFPEFQRIRGADDVPPPTLLQLATHTAGLTREPDSTERFLRGPVAHWLDTLLEALPRTRVASAPGTAYSYSNVGYAILGAALGRAGGASYHALLRERVLQPLGMTHTSLTRPESGHLLARGYSVGPQGIDSVVAAREHAGRGYKVPNGALYSTVDDLAALVALWLDQGVDGVVSDSMRHLVLDRRGDLTRGLTSDYGVGYEVFHPPGNRTWLGHGGAVTGYTAGVLLDRTTRTGVIVLRSASGGRFNIGELAMRAGALVAGAAETPGTGSIPRASPPQGPPAPPAGPESAQRTAPVTGRLSPTMTLREF